MDLIGPVMADDGSHPIELGIVDHEARIEARRIADDAEPQAGRPSAVRHRLADVDNLDLADRPVARDVALKPVPYRRRIARLGWEDQTILPGRQSDQLRVEQVGS